MLNHLNFKENRTKLQGNIAYFQNIASFLYGNLCPASFKNRKNAHLALLSDVDVLALMLFQYSLGITSERKFFNVVKSLVPTELGDKLLHRTRFNRRCRQLLPVISLFRRKLIEIVGPGSDLGIIDSFPMPICHNARKNRAVIFKEIADVGYNATKKEYFYGFKAHVNTTDRGLILNYVITEASVHDSKLAIQLIDESPCKINLADLGYLGKKIVQAANESGKVFWTPYRSNMKGAKEHNSYKLQTVRRRIETSFSVLESSYNIQQNRARSLTGFQTRFEISILSYNLGFFDLEI